MSEHTPRSAAMLLTDALNCLDRLEPEAAREPVRQMFRAGVELCTIKHDLLGERMNYILWLAQALVADEDPARRHRYLSTGCLHGEHGYCQAKEGQQGSKRPAQCKFCGAPCICGCHRADVSPPQHGTLAYRCETCSGSPRWRILRRGDAAVTWACAPHLADVCTQLQRSHEHTELVVSRSLPRLRCPRSQAHEPHPHDAATGWPRRHGEDLTAWKWCDGRGHPDQDEPAQPDRQP